MTKYILDSGTVQSIDSETASAIIEKRRPYGRFIHPENGGFTAIDNSDGNAWTEHFTNLDIALVWVTDDEFDPVDAHNIDDSITSIEVVE